MPRSFLIVDDDERIRRSLSDALDGPHVTVATAPSAEGALQMLSEVAPDVALVDVRMPGMDGLELLRLLRERSPDVAVVIMSAHEDLPTVAAAMRDGAVDFLVKPLDLHAVREVIGRIPQRGSGRGPRSRSAEKTLAQADEVTDATPPAIAIIGHDNGPSAPPATITSASSSIIMRAASPIAWAPVEQAVTTAWLGPRNPYRIETWPAARLIRQDGMKNGLSRRGPFSAMILAPFSIPCRPPMPEPIVTPVRSWDSASSGFHSESSTAWAAAAMAKWMNSSILRWSFGAIH